MIARQCAFLWLFCALLSSCTSAIQSHEYPAESEVSTAIEAARAAQKAGREEESMANLNRIDERILQGASSQYCSEASLQPLLAEHLQLCTFLQAQGNYAAATRVFHSAIALETRVPQWRAAPGPASKAFSGMLGAERIDENRLQYRAARRSSGTTKDHLRRRAVIKKLSESLDERDKLRSGALADCRAGNFSAAAQKLETASQICSDSFGPTSLELAEVLSLRADVLQTQGLDKEGAELRRQALSIYEQSPRRRGQVLKTISDLAETLDRLKQHNEAAKLHARAIALLQLHAQGNAAQIYRRAIQNLYLLGRFAEGAALEKELQGLQPKVPLGSAPSSLLINFGRNLQANKQYTDAIKFYEQALKDSTATETETYAAVSLALFKCKLEILDFEGCNAIANRMRVVSGLTRAHKLELAGLLNLLARELKSTRIARSIELNRLAVTLCEQSNGVNSSEAISSLVQLSDHLRDSGDSKSSAAALLQAASRCKKSTDQAGVSYFRQQIELRLVRASKPAAQVNHRPDHGGRR